MKRINKEQIEERMGSVLFRIVGRQREIETAKHAEEELRKLRAELLRLASQYAGQDEGGKK